jgi:ankyrin repeat protein
LVPLAAIEALIQAYPESIKVEESAYHRLPLHIACRKTANISVVHYLLERYPNACLEPDSLGRLPVHYAISNGANDDVVNLMLKYNPNAARGVDRKGWTPLHVACSIGASTRICKELLELYPEASVMTTHKGTSPFQCLRTQCAANKPEVVALLQKYQEKVQAEKPRPAMQAADRTHHVIV